MGVFGVWCGKCAKYLALGTFTTPAVDALIELNLSICQAIFDSLICHGFYYYVLA